MLKRKTVALAMGLLFAGTLAMAVMATVVDAAPILQTTDFIPNATREQFNGFENVPFDVTYDPSAVTDYTEDGITATMVSGTVGTHGSGVYGIEGEKFWYSNGGNHGYVRITQEDGADFTDVGLLAGDGFHEPDVIFVYDLRLDGIQVLFGSIVGVQGQYLGFSGGGFDEVRLIGAPVTSAMDFSEYYAVLTEIDPPPFAYNPEHYNAIWIDSVETPGGVPVPEPSTLLLLGSGLLGLVGLNRRRKA